MIAIIPVLAAALTLLPLQARATVAARTVEPKAIFNSGILRVERLGNSDGLPIIFIPGLFCGSWAWNAQIDALSDRYDIFAVTLPGFDGRPMVRGDDLMQRAAQSLHRLIVTAQLRRPIVVGHSLGGTLAIFFAEAYPRDAGRIVAVEGGYPTGTTQAARNAAVAQSVKPYEHVSRAALGPALRNNMLQYTITAKPDVASVERLASRSDPAAIVAWMRAALSLDLTPHLSSISVPLTEIIPFDPRIDPYQGFKTAKAKRTAYQRWVSHARDGHVILIEGARHFVMFDKPRDFQQALMAAIALQ